MEDQIVKFEIVVNRVDLIYVLTVKNSPVIKSKGIQK